VNDSTFRRCFGWKSIVSVCVSTVLLSACAGGAYVNGEAEMGQPASQSGIHGPAPETTSASLEPYQEKIPGTLVTLDMIPVPAGTAEVTSDGGTQSVAIEPFWIAKTELPWEAYDAFVYALDEKNGASSTAADAVSRPSKPYVLPGESFGHDGYPALGMTHKAATAFAEWLSASTGKKYRLPTEAEWEYVCRAAEAEPTADALKEHAWYWDNANNQTQKIGSLKPNAWGVHDMLGNTAEWVNTADGSSVVKGGSWMSDAEEVSCSARASYSPDWQMTDPQIPKSTWWLSDGPFIGFRLVRVPD